MPKYQVGFAMSGGFIKGFAHLGAIQALLEHDIKPDMLCGVSAGALAAAFYADGNEPHHCLDYFHGHSFGDFSKIAVSKAGLFSLDAFVDFLKTNLKAKRIEELSLPLYIIATDLDNGKSAVFKRGSLAERVAASCAMPVMFTPRNIHGINYVDGGILKNLPVSFIRKECEQVVAINVSPLQTKEYKKNVWNIAMRSYHFIFQANTIAERELCDLLIEPYNLAGYSNRELERAEEIFIQGYKTTSEILHTLETENHTVWKL
ncbi:MAG: patatin-like phospholipase family protein [Bacteroidaceae bacterium]